MPNKKVESLAKRTLVLNKITNAFHNAKIRGTDRGFKINTEQVLRKEDICKLYELAWYTACEVSIKRSGAGLVVIVDL